MNDSTSAGKKKSFIVLVTGVIVWMISFALSVVVAAITEPAGDGLTRGINRTTVFLKWQAGAVLVSLFCFFIAKSKTNDFPTALRFIGKTPLYAHCVILIFVVGVILYMFVTN